MQQENLEIQINDVTNEVQNFLFQCAKYEKSTQSSMVSFHMFLITFALQNDQTQNEIKRITIKYEDEKKRQDLKQKQKKKLEQHKPPRDKIVMEASAEYDTSAMMGFGGAGDNSMFGGAGGGGNNISRY